MSDAPVLAEPGCRLRLFAVEGGVDPVVAGAGPDELCDVDRACLSEVHQIGSLQLGRIVTAARMGGLSVAHLHGWAWAGLVQSAPFPRPGPHPGAVARTRWVTRARKLEAAAGGDLTVALLAFRARMEPPDLAEVVATGQGSPEQIRFLLSIAGTGSEENPFHV